MALVVLAAGRSARMGSPKALAEFQGRPLLAHLLAGALPREFADVVVVLGHQAQALLPVVAQFGCRYTLNLDPDRGRTGSVQAGLRALRPGVAAAFVQPVDCPIILPETYLALAAAIGPADVAVPVYRGSRGHPPLVSATIMPQILAAGPDEPLRALLEAGQVRRRLVEVDDPGVLVNVDRLEDLRQLARLRPPDRSAERS
jgi:CTP:molybdopterin cytidylyltransferase MocA